METDVKATKYQIWQDEARHIGKGQAIFSENTGTGVC